MNALRWPVQRRTASLYSCAFALATALVAHGARADGPTAGTGVGAEVSAPELVAARELFRQATEDADAGRYAPALEKFRRVAAVKETANVRFNIARCEESLGKTGAALADFELAEREGARGDHDDVATLAHERAGAIRPRVPRLAVTAPSPAPEGLTVTLDGARLAVAALGAALPVDPGAHVVEASAPGRDPFRVQISLVESESKTVPIAMAPGDSALNAAAGAGPSSRRAWGIISLAAGGALGVGSLAFLLLHNSAVSSVESACPDGRCPASRQASVNSDESSARTDQTASIVFAAASAVGMSAGLYLLLSAPSSGTAPTATISPGTAGAPAGISLSGRF